MLCLLGGTVCVKSRVSTFIVLDIAAQHFFMKARPFCLAGLCPPICEPGGLTGKIAQAPVRTFCYRGSLLLFPPLQPQGDALQRTLALLFLGLAAFAPAGLRLATQPDQVAGICSDLSLGLAFFALAWASP